MKLSTKGRYGVRLMLDLALHSTKAPVPLKDIAARQDISGKYLWQLLYLLKKSGLIISTRGVRAGYRLARSPAEITLKEMLVALEGSLCLLDCVDIPSVCSRSSACIARDVWKEAAEGVREVFASFTLDKMIEGHSLKPGTAMYFI